MSDLFRYLCNNSTLCNKPYGTYIDEHPYPYDSRLIEYRKRVFNINKPPIIFYFDNRYGRIIASSYKINNVTITYRYYKKSLYIDKIHHVNLRHYKYFDIYCFDNVYYCKIPYNINCYSSNLRKHMYINTNNKQCIFVY